MESRAVRIKASVAATRTVAAAFARRLKAVASAVKIVAASSLNRQPPPHLRMADVVAMADAVSVQMLVNQADAVAMADQVTYIGVISRAETVAMVDAVAMQGVMALGDAATMADVLTAINFTASQADITAMSDAVAMLGVMALADVATVTDAVAALGLMSFADSATMADAVTVKGTVALADSSAMTDGLTTLGRQTIADTMTAADVMTFAYLTGLGAGSRPGEFWPGAAVPGYTTMDGGGVAPTPPPPPPPPPPPAAQRIALLHFDEINFFTPAASPVQNSASDGASNPFKLAGAAKGWFDPGGKWLTASPANMMHLENDPSCVVSTNAYTWDGEFGVDFWLGSRGNDTYPVLVDISASGLDSDANRLYLQVERTAQAGSTDTIRFLLWRKPPGGAMSQVLTTSTMTIANNAGVMEHIVFQRRNISGTLTIEIAAKGVLLGSIADANTYTGRIAVGGNYSGGTASGFTYLGDMDEVRIEKGSPSFSAMPYAVPTAAYT